MAELNTGDGGGGKKHGKKRAKKMSTRIDMTPMVDLAFLLLTFFVLTTTLRQPTAMNITVPVKKKIDDPNNKPTQVPEARTINIILGKNDKVFYYMGMIRDEQEPVLIETTYAADGLRKILLEKNADVRAKVRVLEEKLLRKEIPDSIFRKEVSKVKREGAEPETGKGLFAIIKPSKESTLKNLVDVFDEMSVCNIPVYANVDLQPIEISALEKVNK